MAESLIVKYELATQSSMDQDELIAGIAAFAKAVRDHCSVDQTQQIIDSVRADADARVLQEWAAESQQLDED